MPANQPFNQTPRATAPAAVGLPRGPTWSVSIRAASSQPHRVVALTEVGDDTDVAELVTEIAALGVTYPHTAVCDCTDTTTSQHVAVLSKIPLSGVVPIIPGREHFYGELYDVESENDAGSPDEVAWPQAEEVAW